MEVIEGEAKMEIEETYSSSWLMALPYSTDDYTLLLNDIVSVAREIIRSNGPNVLLGALLIKNLRSYLRLKYPIPLETRVFLVKTIYFYITRKDSEAFLIEQLAQLCKKLVKNEHQCPDDSMVLNWKPLYHLIEPRILGKERDIVSKKYSLKNVFNLVSFVKRFFPPESTIEILKELLPQINIHNFSLSLSISLVLRQFLPTKKCPPMPSGMPPDAPAFYWTPVVFSLCHFFSNSLIYAQIFMELFASLAENRTHDPKSTGFTESNIVSIFSIGLRCLQLPVGSDTSGKTSNSSGDRIHVGASVFPLAQYPALGEGATVLDIFDKKKMISPFAKFIVYSLYDRPKALECGADVVNLAQYSTIDMLERLIQAISVYFYPSNHGNWSSSMSKLVYLLIFNFLSRIRKEEKCDCKTPAMYKITPSLKRRFIGLLIPILQVSLLSKSHAVVLNSALAIKNMVWISPEIVIPKILSTVENTLEQSQDKPHVVRNCNRVLSCMIYPTLNMGDISLWIQSVPQCLQSSISAISINDSVRTTTALSFISNFSICTPIFDASGTETDNADNYLKLAKEFTSIFEACITGFLEGIFSLMRNLPLHYGLGSKKSCEFTLLSSALHACDDIMQQISPEIEKLAINKILKFTEVCIPNATKAIGVLCASIANPDARLAAFLKRSAGVMIEELDKGAAQHVVNNSSSENSFATEFTPLSDSNFHWHQAIFMHAILFSGITLLKYKHLIDVILLETITKTKSRTGFSWAAKTISYTIFSLASIYPLDARSLPPSTWRKEEIASSISKCWGSRFSVKNAQINWHIPSAEEIDYSFNILTKFFDISIENLRNWLNEPSFEVCKAISTEKWLKVLGHCVSGSFMLMKPSNSNVSKSHTVENSSAYIENLNIFRTRIINTGLYMDETDPRYSVLESYLEQTANIFIEISNKIYLEGECNPSLAIRSMKSLLVFISCKYFSSSIYTGLLNLYNHKKSEVAEAENNNNMLRSLIVKRAHALHNFRVAYNFCQRPIGSLEKDICKEVVKWARCRYSKIRKVAQTGLRSVVLAFNFEINQLVCTDMLEFLESCCIRMDNILKREVTSSNIIMEDKYDKEKEYLHGEIKGVLYALKYNVIPNIDLESWDKKFRLFISLLNLHKYELRHNLRALCHEVIVEVLEKISWMPTEERWVYYRTSEDFCLEDDIIYNEISSSELMQDFSASDRDLKEFINKAPNIHYPQKEEYLSVINTVLVHIGCSNANWIIISLGAEFLLSFLRASEEIPESLVNFALNVIVSDLKSNRSIGIQLLIRIFVIFKLKKKQKVRTWKRKMPVTNELVDQCLSFKPVKKGMLKDTPFLDNTSVGWMCWPKQCVFRYGGSYSENGDILADDIAFNAMRKAFSDKSFWKKFIEFFSEETEMSEFKVSDKLLTLFFRFFFGLFESEFLDPIRGAINGLIVSAKEAEKQKFLAQFTGGIIRGSKHWNESLIEMMWDLVIPIIKKGLFSSGRESFGYWTEYCVLFSLRSRDPRRLFPLISTILNVEVVTDPQIALLEVQKLTLIKLLFSSPCSWRLVDFRKKLLDKCISQLKSTYDIMCECIGYNINTLLQMKFSPGCKDALAAISECILFQKLECKENQSQTTRKVENSVDFLKADSDMLEIVEQITKNSELARLSFNLEKEGNRDYEYLKISKIICAWMVDGISYYRGLGLHPVIHDLIPLLLLMFTCSDTRLQMNVQRIANAYPHVPHTPQMSKKCLDVILRALKEDYLKGVFIKDMWQVRLKILPILQVFTFNHMFILLKDDIERVVEVIVDMLEDIHMEVRLLAAVTLSGIIVCFYQQEVPRFARKFKETLEKYRIPHRSKVNETKEDIKQIDPSLISKRHGAVLGICAIIYANPYNVKPWTADLLSTLARYPNERFPISSSINKLFRDFRHTHQGTWEEDMGLFDEEGRQRIYDILCSQSYYA